MRCATCNNWLLGAEFNNVEIDYCPSCGIWLDDRELELLAGAEGKRFELNLAKSSAKTKRFCPRCNVRLSTVETIATGEKVILDQCPSRHGLWFDKGELEKVLQSMDKTGIENESMKILLNFIRNLFQYSPLIERKKG